MMMKKRNEKRKKYLKHEIIKITVLLINMFNSYVFVKKGNEHIYQEIVSELEKCKKLYQKKGTVYWDNKYHKNQWEEAGIFFFLF